MSNRYVINDMVNAADVNYNDKTIWNIKPPGWFEV